MASLHHSGVILEQAGAQPVSLTGTLTVPPVDQTGDAAAVTDAIPVDQNSEHRSMWEDAVHRNMGNDGYVNVGVLMITWEENLDELATSEEVNELESVFTEIYHFETRRLELNNKTRPQIQLNCALSDFIRDYDDPHSRNLIIVYYSGHGSWNKEQSHFWLEGTNKSDTQRSSRSWTHKPYANWNLAEGSLMGSESDVLVIFDACYAGTLQTKGTDMEERSYEMFSAGGPTRLTEGPGEGSFTQALIEVLKALPSEKNAKDKSFSTTIMTQRVGELRPNNVPLRWNRRRQDNPPIRLSPLSSKLSSEAMSSFQEPDDDAALLTLKFHIKKSTLHCEEIDSLTRLIPQAFLRSGIKCKRIDWVNMIPSRYRFRNAAKEVGRSASIVKKMLPQNGGSLTSLIESLRQEASRKDLQQVDEPACMSPSIEAST